jgi:isoaspartyl peptidase/L-asparaginase-like protein (Ntn-hydrolase superfamily)
MGGEWVGEDRAHPSTRPLLCLGSMKHDRRRFLQLGATGAAGMLAGCALPAEEAPSVPIGLDGPIILSTWDHGLPANAKALEVLRAGGSVLDAVEQGVMVVESDFTNRSVGLGGRPDRDGRVTLDACIQDHDGRAGAVAFVQGFEHPVSIARAVMERTPHVMLVGEGAEQWAARNGFSKRDLVIPEVQAEYRTWLESAEYKPVANIENHDTIGLVAIDASGRIAGTCTTSGMAYKIHGRVGDSPIIGAGLFVDGEAGAATATGVGELMIRVAGSHSVVELMRHGRSPEEACRETVRRIARKHPGVTGMQVGFIALARDGRWGAWSLLEGFTVAVSDVEGTRLVDSGFGA